MTTHVLMSLAPIRKIMLQTSHIVQGSSDTTINILHVLVGGEGIVLGSDLRLMLLHATAILNVAKWFVLRIVLWRPPGLVVGLVP